MPLQVYLDSSDYSTLSGFILNGALYVDNGDRIAKFDLATGAISH